MVGAALTAPPTPRSIEINKLCFPRSTHNQYLKTCHDTTFSTVLATREIQHAIKGHRYVSRYQPQSKEPIGLLGPSTKVTSALHPKTRLRGFTSQTAIIFILNA